MDESCVSETETETTAGLDIVLERKTCKRTNEK